MLRLPSKGLHGDYESESRFIRLPDGLHDLPLDQ